MFAIYWAGTCFLKQCPWWILNTPSTQSSNTCFAAFYSAFTEKACLYCWSVLWLEWLLCVVPLKLISSGRKLSSSANSLQAHHCIYCMLLSSGIVFTTWDSLFSLSLYKNGCNDSNFIAAAGLAYFKWDLRKAMHAGRSWKAMSGSCDILA